MGPLTSTRCAVCGYEEGEHNPETHAAEARAEAYAAVEPYERDDADRDYEPADDAVCARCGDVGVEWNVEIHDGRGGWATICTDCEQPADWAAASSEEN